MERCAQHRPGSCLRSLRIGDDADMRGHDAPPFRKADPGLHLPAHLADQRVAIKQRGGHSGMAAVAGDQRSCGPPPKTYRRARGPKGHDLLVTIKIFTDAITKRSSVGM